MVANRGLIAWIKSQSAHGSSNGVRSACGQTRPPSVSMGPAAFEARTISLCIQPNHGHIIDRAIYQHSRPFRWQTIFLDRKSCRASVAKQTASSFRWANSTFLCALNSGAI